MSVPRSPLSSPPPTAAGPDRATEDRILDAAAHVFADEGYEHATIREVCARAGANVAAVNYHFESKERLYLETLRRAMRLCHGDDRDGLLALAARTDLDREELLLETVRRFATSVLTPRPEWHTRLLLRELTRTTPADATTRAIVDEFIAPRFAALKSAVAAFLSPGTPPEAATLHAMSVTGQILYHRIASPVALHLLGREAYDADLVARIADHVARFTLAALRAGGSVEPEGAP